MERAAKIDTYHTAHETFETAMENLTKCCGCSVCCPRPAKSPPVNDGPTNSQPNTINTPRYCLVVLTVTIVRLIRGLSRIDPISELHPTGAGIEYMNRTTQTRIWRLTRRNKKSALPTICAAIEGAAPGLKWSECRCSALHTISLVVRYFTTK